MRKNLLCIGDVLSPYRSAIIMTRLIDYEPDKKINVILVSKSYVSPEKYGSILGKSLAKIISDLYYWIDLFLKLPFTDVVYLMPQNHKCFLPLYILNLVFRKPIISDLYVSLYDTRMDRGAGELSTTNRILNNTHYLKLLDRLIIEKSTLVTHPTKGELIHISETVGAKLGENYAILPLAVKRRRHADPTHSDIFRICWWGSWIPLHGIENILRATKIVAQKGYNIHLDLLGTDSPEARDYIKFIEELSVEKWTTVYYNKSFTNGLLEEHLVKHCDLALGNFGNSEKAKNVITNKIIDAMAMQIPVLTMNNPVLEEFFDINNDLFVSSNDPAEIAAEIISIISNPSECKRRSINGHERYLKDFTPEKYYEDFTTLIYNVAGI